MMMKSKIQKSTHDLASMGGGLSNGRYVANRESSSRLLQNNRAQMKMGGHRRNVNGEKGSEGIVRLTSMYKMDNGMTVAVNQHVKGHWKNRKGFENIKTAREGA